MALVKILNASLGEGVSCWMTYNDANNKLMDVEWDIPPGESVSVTIWKDGQVVYEVFLPPGQGSQNVAGNIVLVEQDDGPPFGVYLTLPPGYEWSYTRIG